MADVGQYAMLRKMPDAEYHDLHEIIGFMNEKKQKGLMATMERKQKLMRRSRKMSGQVLLEDQELQDLGGGSGVAEEEEEGDQGVSEGKEENNSGEGKVTQKAASGFQSSTVEVVYLTCLRLR